MGAQYMECSSKEMIGVEEVFERAVTMAVGDESKGTSSSSCNGGMKRRKRNGCKIL
jgi:hypothetical protein